MLVDEFGRHGTDLRISVTDRCNYRCTYCMPANVEWLPKSEILNFDEIERLARIFAAQGVTQIRLTGGEPLVRRDLPVLIARLAAIKEIEDISLTTNGYYLKEQASQIYDAGIRRINISLDTLHPERFAKITRNDSFEKVMQGIEQARATGFHPIKINCVAIRGFNDDEIIDFVRWGRENNLQIRFIEFMPLDGDHKWSRLNVLSKAEIVEMVNSFASADEIAADEPSPATRYALGLGEEFGVIPSVTEPFCANCTRIRITADGKFRTCLFAIEETDLRGPLRSGRNDEEIGRILQDAIRRKWAGHKINDPDFVQPPRAMNAIGG